MEILLANKNPLPFKAAGLMKMMAVYLAHVISCPSAVKTHGSG